MKSDRARSNLGRIASKATGFGVIAINASGRRFELIAELDGIINRVLHRGVTKDRLLGIAGVREMPLDCRKIFVRVFWFTAAVSVCAIASAQPPAAAPAPAGAAAAAGEDEPIPESPPLPVTPEESPLLEEPQSAKDVLEAVDLTYRLARYKLARQYLDQFLALNVDDDTMLQLVDQYGSAFFHRLANQPELQPASGSLLSRVIALYRRRGISDQRIDALLDRLSGPPTERNEAIEVLRSTGPIVVPRFLVRLADPKHSSEYSTLIQALSRMGQPAVAPLIAAVETPDTALRAAVIEALGWLRSTAALPHLWFPAVAPNEVPGARVAAQQAIQRILQTSDKKTAPLTTAEVTAELHRLALEHFASKFPWQLNDQRQVEFWTWRDAARNVAPNFVTPEAASLYLGGRFAKQALMLSPENEQLQALFVAFSLAAATREAGDSQSLPAGPGTAHDIALASGADRIQQALALSLANRNGDAALGCLSILGQIGTANDLLYSDVGTSPLIAALNSPDSRVQFAAARAILQLEPTRQFPGADLVVPILARALTSNGDAAAVIIDPNLERGTSVAALVGELGFDPLLSRTGREGFQLSANRMDVRLIALHINTIDWPLSMSVANLRADARTASVPIAIYGPASMEVRVENLIRRNQPMTYVVEAIQSQELDSQLRPFLAKQVTPSLSVEERAARAREAAYWLAFIASTRRTDVFDLSAAETALITAVADPQLRENVLLTASAVRSASMQRFLQGLTVTPSNDPSLRVSAARQLVFHIQRFGLLLSDSEIAQLRQGLTAAANDPELATAITAVLGTLHPNAKLVGQRLQDFPAAPLTQP